MREIPLTQGQVALVDDEDYKKLSKYKWFAIKYQVDNFYAARQTPGHNGKLIRMHRQILDFIPAGHEVDHFNGNSLDNRKENLRVVTHRQNMQNKHINTSSKYPGVYWDKHAEKWHTQIRINGKRESLGYYESEEAAFVAYRDAISNLGETIHEKYL